ncbi:MAG: hypothetical protein M1449_11330, partial [Candidatus Thermoplasmatota archaeon]|nr:hypothetical protein [Candidatus Thermoplasmatota archaeon]
MAKKSTVPSARRQAVVDEQDARLVVRLDRLQSLPEIRVLLGQADLVGRDQRVEPGVDAGFTHFQAQAFRVRVGHHHHPPAGFPQRAQKS